MGTVKIVVPVEINVVTSSAVVVAIENGFVDVDVENCAASPIAVFSNVDIVVEYVSIVLLDDTSEVIFLNCL